MISAPVLSPVRRSANRLRGLVATPAAEVPASELGMLVRWLVIGILLAGSMSAYLWASTGVRETAMQIDSANRALTDARTENERLQLTRTMLRSPSRVQADAARLGLVAPTATVDLVPAGVTP